MLQPGCDRFSNSWTPIKPRTTDVTIRSLVKRALLKRGYRVTRVSGETNLGWDPFDDMAELTLAGDRPVVFDVGANLGQSIRRFRRKFSRPVVHSFEPSPATFKVLQANTAGISDLFLNNVALGSGCERKVFIENEFPDMSSFLEPGKDAWGTVVGRQEIDVDTVDDYCGRRGIPSIHILKSDTQGFDLEVLKGASGMLDRHRIHLIYMEIIFSRMYKDLPPFDEIYRFLSDHSMHLVAFYAMAYQNNRAGWADALFVDPEYRLGSNSLAS